MRKGTARHVPAGVRPPSAFAGKPRPAEPRSAGAAGGPALAIAAMAVIVIVVAIVVWRASFRDTATPVAATDLAATRPTTNAVDSTAGPTDATSSIGAAAGPGIYVYATSGHEEVDALGGARHDYPPETVLQVLEEGCGLVLLWQPLEERFDRRELCPDDDGGFVQERSTSFHRWFGRDDRQDFTCSGEAWLVPPDPNVTQWSYECSTEERTEAFEAEVVATEELSIGGSAVTTVRVRTISTLTGATEGESRVDAWWLAGGTVPVRVVAERTSTTGSLIGDVSYAETYELNLTSLDPADR